VTPRFGATHRQVTLPLAPVLSCDCSSYS